MKCPFCQHADSRVTDSRELSNGNAIRRRRECGHCGRRFTTYERIEDMALVIVKRDGRRQEFDPVKLRNKLRLAFTKRPVGETEIDAIIARTESALLALGVSEAPSTAIGEIVLKELKEIDPVAYIRFASVYLQFSNLEDLAREVNAIRAATEAETART